MGSAASGAAHVEKAAIPAGAKLVLLGGPALRIGLGGGAASSLQTGKSHEELDFASVQRGNPEMQRRCQEVIDRCWALGDRNPILSIHDVGAGGISNALPELVHAAGRGARLELRAVPNDDLGMSPLEIWCNEAQERYALAIAPERLGELEALCRRERCPYALLGEATDDGRLLVSDAWFGNAPIDLPLDVVLGRPPRMVRDVKHERVAHRPLDLAGVTLPDAAWRVLHLPAVADKTFLVTIADRTVGGLCSRDPMVGPWQVPVADAAVTCASFEGYAGEAMALGERAPLALVDPAASARMAVGEALTNLLSADVARLGDVKLSANWMAAAGHPGEDAGAVRRGARGRPGALPRARHRGAGGQGLALDADRLGGGRLATERHRAALAGRHRLRARGGRARAAGPRSSARTGVPSVLLLVDLGRGRDRLGARPSRRSTSSSETRRPTSTTRVTSARWRRRSPSSGNGSWSSPTTIAPTAASSPRCSRWRSLETWASRSRSRSSASDSSPALFSEELGVALQVREADLAPVLAVLERHGLAALTRQVARPAEGGALPDRRPRGRRFHGDALDAAQLVERDDACACSACATTRAARTRSTRYARRASPCCASTRHSISRRRRLSGAARFRASRSSASRA